MKTQRLSNQNTTPSALRKAEQKEQNQEAGHKAQEQVNHIAQQLRELQTKKAVQAKQALEDLLERSIEWRELRFHRVVKDGNDYVDIIDRVSGEVIKTIPEPDFVRLANNFKQHPGLTLDITS